MIELLVVVALIALSWTLLRAPAPAPSGATAAGDLRPLRARRVLDSLEQRLYFSVATALGQEFIVMCKVPLPRLFAVTTSGHGWTATMARLTADFAILSRDARVLAIVEIECPGADRQSVAARRIKRQMAEAAGVGYLVNDGVTPIDADALRRVVRALAARRHASLIAAQDAFANLADDTRLVKHTVLNIAAPKARVAPPGTAVRSSVSATVRRSMWVDPAERPGRGPLAAPTMAAAGAVVSFGSPRGTRVDRALQLS